MSGYQSRYWADRTPSARRKSYPAFAGHENTDVVVIGGGLTGCMTAAVMAGGGLDVVLVESGRLATGATAGGLGLALPAPEVSFRAVEAAIGRRAARAAWTETRRSARELVSTLRKLPTKNDVAALPLVVNTRASDEAALLRRDQQAMKQAGLEASWLSARSTTPVLGSESAGALRFRDAATFDPVRAALGFAGLASSRGARIFERSSVRRTTFTRTQATVVLATGTIAARGIVVATGEPGVVAPQLRRHVRRSTGYAVVTHPLTAAMRKQVGPRGAVVVDTSADPRFLRWLPDDRALFAGALSKPVGSRQADSAVRQRTAQLMYEFSVRYPAISGLPAAWGWDVPVVSTLDGLPWIGPHRNYPFHFFAVGFGWTGDAMAWFAARAALRHFKGESRKEDAAFGFTR